MSSDFSRDLVLRVARLAGTKAGITVAGLVHLLPLLTGNRNTCRLVMGSDAASALAFDLGSAGLVTVLTPMSHQKLGDDWFELSRGSNSSNIKMVVVARDNQTAEEIVDAEFNGRFRDSGRLLEYPTCCVDAYGELNEYVAYWPSYYLKRSSTVSPWCNRLIYLWGACCPTGELFPCSLTCSHAVELGKSNMEALSAVGMHRLRSAICTTAQSPLRIDWNGRVHRGTPTTASDRSMVMEQL